MPSLVIDRFLGLDKKSSDTDLDKRIAKKLENLSTTKKFGALSKDGAYTDVSSTLVAAVPTGITFKSLFQFSITSPSSQDTYLLYGLDGSSNERIYWGNYWNGSSFTAGWLELTEHEGPYTIAADDITAGTDADNLIIKDTNALYASLSTTADYYNDWFLVATNNTATHAGNDRLALRVTDYAIGATTKTFTIKTGGLTGVVATDKFTLCRNQVLADGIAESGSGTPPRYAGLPQVDTVIRWLKRENSAIGMTGNTNQFPSQYQLWFGYVNRTFGKTNAVAVNDFFLEMEQLQAPDALAYGGDITTGSGNLDAAFSYAFHACFVYDGVQLGPLANIFLPGQSSLSGSTSYILAQGRIPFDISYSADGGPAAASAHLHDDFPTNYNTSLLSRRVTAIRIYLEKLTSYDPTFVIEYDIASSDTSIIDCVMDSNGVLEIPSTTFSEEASGNTYLQDAGQTNIRPNFKYGAAISSHFLAAAIRNESGDKEDNDLIASVVDGAGVSTPDNFGASNVINLGFFGSKEITGVHVLGDEGVDRSPKARALVFTDDDYYVLNIVSGSSFSHDLDNVGTQEGLVAPDSLTYAEGNLFGVSRNGFRIFAASGTKIIGEGLKNDFDSLTTSSEGIGSYFKKERIVVFHFPTNLKTFVVDLLSKDFQMFEYSWADDFQWFTPQRAGTLLSLDADKIYQIGSGSDQDGTKIVPLWRSKRFTAADLQADDWGGPGTIGDEMTFIEGYIKYKSDTAITLKFYRENSASEITFNALSLAAKSTEGEARFLFPNGVNAYEAEVEVLLDATQKTSNTSFELNSLRIKTIINSRID